MLGLSALNIAIDKKNVEIIKLLLKHSKANINLQQHRTFRTPLHFAVRTKSVAIVQSLLEHKPQLNIRDLDGNSALHLAAEAELVDIFELLLKAGSNPMLLNHR